MTFLFHSWQLLPRGGDFLELGIFFQTLDTHGAPVTLGEGNGARRIYIFQENNDKNIIIHTKKGSCESGARSFSVKPRFCCHWLYVGFPWNPGKTRKWGHGRTSPRSFGSDVIYLGSLGRSFGAKMAPKGWVRAKMMRSWDAKDNSFAKNNRACSVHMHLPLWDARKMTQQIDMF